jgi:hypothetical protein
VGEGGRNLVRSAGIKSHARHLLQVPEVTCIQPSINIFGYRIFNYLKIKKNNPLNLHFSIRLFCLHCFISKDISCTIFYSSFCLFQFLRSQVSNRQSYIRRSQHRTSQTTVSTDRYCNMHSASFIRVFLVEGKD